MTSFRKYWLSIVIMYLLSCAVALGHEQNVHQYIVREAYSLLKLRFGDIPVMKDHVGISEIGSGPWQTGMMVAGAWREDVEDPVYGYSDSWPPGVSGTHFWRADDGDESDVTLRWLSGGIPTTSTIPSAYKKIRRYAQPAVYGQWAINYDYGTSHINTLPCGTPVILGFTFQYDDLVTFYRTGQAYITGYRALDGLVYSCGGRYPVVFAEEFTSRITFEILGRMCHLLGDMSVPAHAHGDAHGKCDGDPPGSSGVLNDTYERWVGSDGPPYYSPYLAWNGTNSGTLVNPFVADQPLHFLMYTTQQIADHYGSNGPYNGDGNDNLPISSGPYAFLTTLLPTLGQPTGMAQFACCMDPSDICINREGTTLANRTNIRDHTLPYAIRATAGLLYWFIEEAGLLENILFVPDQYPTISQALSAATSGKTVRAMSGSYTIDSDVDIRSGVTLQLNSANVSVAPDAIMIMYGGSNLQLISSSFSCAQLGLVSGATINSSGSTFVKTGGDLTIPTGSSLQCSGSTFQFAPGRKLRIQGTLVTTGPNTFTSINGQWCGWYGIEYYNTPTGNALYNATIQNAQYGLFIYNSYVDVMSCLVQWNSTGIYTSCNSIAVRYNQLENNSVGVDCAYYGSPTISPSNRLREMDFAVRCDGTSQPYLGSYIGYNSLYWNGWDVFSSYPGSIWAWGNWWGSYPADPWVYGTVDWSNPLQLDPNLQKAVVRKHQLIAPPTLGVLAKDTVGLGFYESLRLKDLANTSVTSASGFQTLVDQYPDKLSGRMAIARLAQIQENQGSEVRSFLANVTSKFEGRAVARVASQLQIGAMVKAGNYREAFSLAKSLVQGGDTLTLKQAIYDAGSLAWYYLDDKPTGATYFTRLANEYAEDPLANSALAAMGQVSAKPAPKSQVPLENPASFELGTNYPNPFNPSTQISYSLADPGIVSLVIYDVLGREIATLANGNQQAGHYNVNWNSQNSGTPVSSGMYFARLRVLNELGGVKFAKTIKLLLTK